MTVRFAAATSRRHSLRTLALVGSALGSTLVTQSAAAQNQTYTGPTNQTIPGTVTGGPTTITATTSTGDIVLTVDTVVANNTGSGTAAPGTNAAVYAFNSGTGNTTVSDVNATITGSGASNGIFAAAQGGTVIINQTGKVDATNAINGRGITAASNGGTIVINANEADGGLRGVFTGSTGATAGSTGNLAASTTINVTTAIATGAGNTPNAIVAQGQTVVLNSGTASLTNTAGTNGTAILVNAGASATVTSGTANAFGQGQAAILAAADGVLNLTSGSVRATQNSDGISIQGSTPGETITVKSGAILLDGANSGYGLVLGGNHGGNFSSGANGLAYGSATVTSDTITTAGANSYAIYATPNGAGTTAITSNNITTTGAGSYGIYEAAIGNGAIAGASTINSTGTLKTSGAGANGIQVAGTGANGSQAAAGTGAVTVNNTGTVTTSGNNAYGIDVVGSTGAVNILGGGTVNVSGTGSRGIYASTTTGAITINVGTTTTTGAYDANPNIDGSVDAVLAYASGAGTINITSVNASAAGQYSSAVYGYGNGPVTITSGTASTTGASGVAVGASARATGDATVNANTTTATGAGASAVSAQAVGGNATVIAASASAANGGAVSVIAGAGLATATVTGSASSGGNGYAGVSATGTTGVALNVGTASSTGATTSTTTTRNNVTTTTTRRADAVYASTTNGAINATVNNASATGPLGTNTTSGQTFTADGVRLLATGTGGAVTLKGTGTLSSQSGYGLYVNTINADVTAGTVNSAGVNLAALEVDLGAPTGTATSAKVTTSAVNATGAGSRGIFVTGPTGSTATISGGAITTAGGNGVEISGGFGNTAISSTSIAGATIGVNALNVAGTLAINSGTIALPTTAVAANAFVAGISASGTGAITINSGTITGNAANAGYGINATGNTGGSVAITSGSISSFGRNAIVGQTNTGALSVTSTGTITTATVGGSTGNNGIQLFSTSGPITVTSNNIAASGDQSLGIVASAGTGGTAAVNVTSTGTLTTTGTNSGGIQATGAGAVTVNANDVRTTGTAVFASGAGAVGVTAGTTRASGTALGLNGQSSGGFVTVTSTDLAAGGIGIFASGATGAAVTSGTLTAATTTSFGILSQVSTPAQGSTIVPTGVSVNSTTLTSAGGGIRTSSLTASTAITSGAITTSGTNLAAIYSATTTGNINLTSGSLNASGTSGNGISANTTTGNILINSTSAITTGSYLASTNNSPDAITAFTSASGSGTVTINSGTASATGDLASAIFGYGGGNVTITSGTATTAGNGVGGTIVALGANSRQGDASVTATTTTATGTNSSAVSVTSAVGNATAALGTASAINGQALTVNAGKLANVTANTLSSGGDGFAGVFAQGGTGVTLNVGSASSSGTLTTTTNTTTGVTTTRRADAIYATAIAGTIDATIGSAKATGAGADAVRLIANGTGGAVTARITGALSSTSGYGLFIDPPGANTVTVASGASISGATAGISLTGSSNTIINAGTITGTAGPGILASGATALDNSGGIAGTGGVAVQLGATNDTVTLRTGSAVTGAIVGGGGTDSATLIGTNNAATGAQQSAAFNGFDNLMVQSGYWTATAANPSAFATSATISGGATLDVANGATGLTLTAPSIVDNGALVVRGSSASAGSTFGSSIVTGNGSALLTGGMVTLDRANSLQNTGATTIDTGTTVLLTGTQAGNFINNGTLQVGNGGTTGLFTGTLADNGTVVSNRSDSYAFTGALTGAGTFVKNGAGTVTFGTNYAFTGVTQLNGGGVKLSTPVAPTTKLDAEGTGTYDLSGVNQTIAQLSGSSTGAMINITNDALTVNQDTTTSFAGAITGSGSLTKTGSGSLNLTGTNTYTGTTTINGGRLAVNGSITSPVTVNSGGTLGGNGTVGNTVIGSGGTFAPGNSIGTTNVAGNLTFQAGSNYQVEANAAGMADRVNTSGTITINGGTVQVLAAPGTYNPITQYTILTATGGVTGQFAGVTSSLAFLSPLLTYGTNAVTLGLYRNDINFASMAASPNGAAVAGAIASRGFGNALYNAVLVQTATGAPVAFNQLSGEIHATIPSVLIDSDRRVRDAVLDHNHGALRPGLGLWLQSLGTTAHSRAQGALANVSTTRLGVVGGVDYALGDVRIGLNGGYFNDRLRNPNVFSRAQIGTELIGGSIAWMPEGGRLTAQGGITHAWHHVDTTRTVTVTGLAGSYQSVSTAHTTQAFGEIAFALIDGPVAVTPFARYAHDWERADGFNETGGIAALSVARERRSNDFGSAGVRLSGSRPIADGLAIEPNLSLGYLHSWGRLYSVRSETIGGAAFSITGDRLGRDNLDANGGVDLVVKDQLRLGVSGYLTRSSQWRDYGGKASVSFRF